jgi:hypothetical protein
MSKLVWLVVGLLVFPAGAHAIVEGEPGSCDPPCRSGFHCRGGKCVSLCNPPCNAGERCVKGECELMPRPGGPPRPRDNYIAVLGSVMVRINSATLTVDGRSFESNATRGELRVEFGGRYTALQIGPVFGSDATMLRTGILGYVPLRPSARIPLFLVPTIGLGYAFSWAKDLPSVHWQDIFLTPGLRLRYDVIPRMAVFADLIQLQINFLRLVSSPTMDVTRADVVPLTWNFAVGLAFLY